MAKKPQSNTEFVTHLMEFSRCGPIMQMFVLDALEKQASRFADMTPQQLQEAWGDFNFISPDAWVAAAKELRAALDSRA